MVLGSEGDYKRVDWQQYDQAVEQGAKRLTATTTTVHLATDDEDFDRRYDAGLPVEERRLVLYDRDASEAQEGYPHTALPIEYKSWRIDEAPTTLIKALEFPL